MNDEKLPIFSGGLDGADADMYVSASVPAIVMMVFQYVTNPGFHSQIVECIMALKKNVFKVRNIKRRKCEGVEQSMTSSLLEIDLVQRIVSQSFHLQIFLSFLA